ncbi:hypothetical protein [Streptomyces spectabilis]|uniref:Uncharacterized protein n=1 Tax=Streptomyces spectabilis TaxID=68270 RepID=A0A5P2XBC5_STRST|nr:hypothetical protein [Streptomyces spectabilis]MBB5109507.1 hypothetical protein [Streptomyces spectabilis]MCI3904622.1 hypothetical protein [Streptomyces spectabilis]QEV61701.1 hypothetical protein CP982_25805 [Streptomyces spectabilis]GGV54546.1 hypothetical protein GCM10010245_86190 [Streptomyces spectabilis]
MRGDPPREYQHTESTRLLSVGARQNADFRRRVIGELVGHAERPVAPPLGADVLPVLAHALRARREEIVSALLLFAVWAGFVAADTVMAWDAANDRAGGDAGLSLGDTLLLAFDGDAAEGPGDASGALLPGGWALWFAAVVFLLWCGRIVSGRDTGAGQPLRPLRLPAVLVWLRRRFGWLVTVLAWVFGSTYWFAALTGIAETPYPVIFPLLVTVVVWRHQFRAKRVLRTQLARQVFAETDQPELPARYAGIAECVRREQRAPLTLYDVNRPFVGAGKPRKPWSVVLELKRDDRPDAKGVPPQGPRGPLTARDVIDMIDPRLKGLRRSAGDTSKDRLRHLEIDEFVYLPSGAGRDEKLYTGRGHETARVYDASAAERHLVDAVGEGGEARRHFLRLRVGSWNEQVVVSLLVRVHTQGGMLVLEVVPHVLGPVLPEFRRADAVAVGEPEGPVRDALRACVDGPAFGVAIGIGALRALPSLGAAVRRWCAAGADEQDGQGPQGPAGNGARHAGARPLPRAVRALRALGARLLPVRTAPPDAPLVSLRELAATDELSLFQEMDVARYTKTLQDRIGEGVREALQDSGYRTDRLEQNITQINNSGVYINEMSGGALATGAQGQATHMEKSTV